MRKEVRLDYYTGRIVAAAIAKAKALRNAQDELMYKIAEEMEIPNPEGRYNISNLRTEGKHSFIDIKLEGYGTPEHLHAKFCDKKLVLTAKDENGNTLGSNTMQLAQRRK